MTSRRCHLFYQTQYTDPTTNDVLAQARWYSPTSGTFRSRDTWAGNLNTPVTLNRYTYGSNNPIRYWDPTGRLPCQNPDSCLQELDQLEQNYEAGTGTGAIGTGLIGLEAHCVGKSDCRPMTSISPASVDASTVLVEAENGLTDLGQSLDIADPHEFDRMTRILGDDAYGTEYAKNLLSFEPEFWLNPHEGNPEERSRKQALLLYLAGQLDDVSVSFSDGDDFDTVTTQVAGLASLEALLAASGAQWAARHATPTTVYVKINPQTQRPYYVGITTQSLAARNSGHVNSANYPRLGPIRRVGTFPRYSARSLETYLGTQSQFVQTAQNPGGNRNRPIAQSRPFYNQAVNHGLSLSQNPQLAARLRALGVVLDR